MDSNAESSNSEIQEVSEAGTPSDHTDGTTDPQESITRLRAFDIQSPTGPAPSQVSYGGGIKTWKPMNTDEEMRRALALWTLRLLFAWVLIGLVIFLISGNGWLLTVPTVPLAWPVKKVFDYYFGDLKK